MPRESCAQLADGGILGCWVDDTLRVCLGIADSPAFDYRLYFDGHRFLDMCACVHDVCVLTRVCVLPMHASARTRVLVS